MPLFRMSQSPAARAGPDASWPDRGRGNRSRGGGGGRRRCRGSATHRPARTLGAGSPGPRSGDRGRGRGLRDEQDGLVRRSGRAASISCPGWRFWAACGVVPRSRQPLGFVRACLAPAGFSGGGPGRRRVHRRDRSGLARAACRGAGRRRVRGRRTGGEGRRPAHLRRHGRLDEPVDRRGRRVGPRGQPVHAVRGRAPRAAAVVHRRRGAGRRRAPIRSLLRDPGVERRAGSAGPFWRGHGRRAGERGAVHGLARLGRAGIEPRRRCSRRRAAVSRQRNRADRLSGAPLGPGGNAT